MWAILIAVLAFNGPAEWPAESELQQLPNCGVGCAWTLLRLHGQTHPVEEISAKFKSLGVETADRVSILDLRNVLETYGIPSEAIRIPPRDLAELKLPAILYFRPGQWSQRGAPEVGHFVVLTRLNPSDAVVVNWTPLGVVPEHSVPLKTLLAKWDGEAIVLDDPIQRMSLWAIALLILMLICGGVCFVRSQQKRPTNMLAGLILLAQRISLSGGLTLSLIGVAGCSSPAPTPVADGSDAPIVFKSPIVDLGVLEAGDSRTHSFPFRTWDRSPVRISKVTTSCACSVLEGALPDGEIPPGTDHQLALRIQTVPAFEGKLVFAKIETYPPASAPISIGIRFRTHEPPRPSQNPLIVETVPNERPQTELIFTARRSPSEPATTLKSCVSDEFELLNVVSEATRRVADASGSQIGVEQIRATLRLRRSYGYGEHPGRLKFRWGNGRESELTAYIRVKPPGVPLSDRMFCGVLNPEAEWKLVIPLRRLPSETTIQSVKFERGLFSAQLGKEGRLIQLSGPAPSTPGRFSDTLVVVFNDAKYPSYRVLVTGVVREGVAD